MYRIDDPSAAATLPTPEAANTEGYWTEGNPGTGTPATLVRASFLNMLQEELRAIPVAAGLTPSKTTYNQILSALKAMFSPVVGQMRNGSMSVATASASATFTADEIVVETAIGGQTYRLASFSKTINLATTGAGGMDTGSAPASGFVALYAIYNPSSGASALLAVNATSAAVTEVYGGANMPAGYTASALVSVVPTNASSQIAVLFQRDRKVACGATSVISNSTINGSNTIINNLAIPLNARFCSGFLQIGNSAAAAMSLAIYASAASVGLETLTGNVAAGSSLACPFRDLPVSTPQRMFYSCSSGAGTPTFSIQVTGYEF